MRNEHGNVHHFGYLGSVHNIPLYLSGALPRLKTPTFVKQDTIVLCYLRGADAAAAAACSPLSLSPIFPPTWVKYQYVVHLSELSTDILSDKLTVLSSFIVRNNHFTKNMLSCRSDPVIGHSWCRCFRNCPRILCTRWWLQKLERLVVTPQTAVYSTFSWWSCNSLSKFHQDGFFFWNNWMDGSCGTELEGGTIFGSEKLR